MFRLDRNRLLWIILTVPILSIFVSLFHLVEMYKSRTHFAYISAIVIEVTSIITFLILIGIIKYKITKRTKRLIRYLFYTTYGIQMFANVYSTILFMNANPEINKYIETFHNMFFGITSFIGDYTKVVLAYIISIPIPLISILLFEYVLEVYVKTQKGMK